MVTVTIETADGEIRPEVLYELALLKKRAGLGDGAIRTARKSGMRVIRRAGRNWILGSDFIRYLSQQSESEA